MEGVLMWRSWHTQNNWGIKVVLLCTLWLHFAYGLTYDICFSRAFMYSILSFQLKNLTIIRKKFKKLMKEQIMLCFIFLVTSNMINICHLINIIFLLNEKMCSQLCSLQIIQLKRRLSKQCCENLKNNCLLNKPNFNC